MSAAVSLAGWSAIRVVGDHVWQSTLVAVALGLLTLAFRNNRANVRYGLWLGASLKFFLPFAALAAIGSRIGWRSSSVRPGLTLVFDTVSQPFSTPVLPHAAASLRAAAPVASHSGFIAVAPFLLPAIWCGGCAAILAMWAVRWRRMAAVVRSGTRVETGREVDALRRLECAHGMAARIALVVSDTTLEPGVFGIAMPVLLWPSGISARLDDGQMEAVFSHEVCHVRRRDNLAAALHMFVEAVFWFHPLVWWLGARLIDERERACDEGVVRLGSTPLVYAESLLKTCEFCVKSPLVCVAGVTGSDLKRRIERIMVDRRPRAMSSWRKVLLAAVGAAAVAAPIVLGAVDVPRLQAYSLVTGAPPSVPSVEPVFAQKPDEPSPQPLMHPESPSAPRVFQAELRARNGQGSQRGAFQCDTKGVEFGPWLKRFIQQVYANWSVPQEIATGAGHVVITFNVHKSGALTDVTVVAPCPIDSFNTAAFGSLVAANPASPLPPEYPDEKAFFTVTFFYNEPVADAAPAQAQGRIEGTAKDRDSGAPLKGVTVTLASDALTEGSRTATTNGDGAYTIANLPPGIYTVEFTLMEYSTVKFDGLTLPNGFTATANAAMKEARIRD
jgi:beta-lactamase regulating signal transducer with metallopeptidase domain